MTLFEEHPLRQTLNDEVHARPPVALQGSELVTCLAFLHENGSADRELEHLRVLAQQLGLTEPANDAVHLMLEANDFRLKWERHSEFSSYTFFRRAEATPSADNGALLAVPTAWRKAIPGRLIVASHVEVRGNGDTAAETMLKSLGDNEKNQTVSRISEGASWVFTDFRLHDISFRRCGRLLPTGAPAYRRVA